MLLRFRLYQNAMTADIQAMYLQVRIPEQERDCLRFLWLENGEVKPYRMTSHLFGGGCGAQVQPLMRFVALLMMLRLLPWYET